MGHVVGCTLEPGSPQHQTVKCHVGKWLRCTFAPSGSARSRPLLSACPTHPREGEGEPQGRPTFWIFPLSALPPWGGALPTRVPCGRVPASRRNGPENYFPFIFLVWGLSPPLRSGLGLTPPPQGGMGGRPTHLKNFPPARLFGSAFPPPPGGR